MRFLISATAWLLILEPKTLLVNPPTTLSPPPIIAPQGPGIALATLLNPLNRLPAPEVMPPDIAFPRAPPTTLPVALITPPAVPVPAEPKP